MKVPKTTKKKTFNLPYLMHHALGSVEVAGEESPMVSSSKPIMRAFKD